LDDARAPMSYYDLILKPDRLLGWKLEVYGDKTKVKDVLDSLKPSKRRYLGRRLDFKS